MDADELEACRSALEDIISVCDSYKGLADSYKDKPEEGDEQSPSDLEALIVEADEGPQHQEAETAEPAAEEASEPAPMRILDRPGARMGGPPREEPVKKRGPGRPRKGSY